MMRIDSFEVAELVKTLRREGIDLSVVADRVRISAPPGTPPEVLDLIGLRKSEIIRYSSASGSPLTSRISPPSGEVQHPYFSSPWLQVAGSPPPVREGEPGEPPGGDQKQPSWEGRENDPYWRAARSALSRFESVPWPCNLGRWLSTNYPDVHRILFKALPEELDRIWNDQAGLELFMSALGRWVQAHHDAVALYEKAASRGSRR